MIDFIYAPEDGCKGLFVDREAKSILTFFSVLFFSSTSASARKTRRDGRTPMMYPFYSYHEPYHPSMTCFFSLPIHSFFFETFFTTIQDNQNEDVTMLLHYLVVDGQQPVRGNRDHYSSRTTSSRHFLMYQGRNGQSSKFVFSFHCSLAGLVAHRIRSLHRFHW